MKSLATTFLIFVICVGVSGTNALIDRAQGILAASSGGRPLIAGSVSGGNVTTLAEFAVATQGEFRLAQPAHPVAFDDLRPNDRNYAAAQAVYPYLHRQLLCPECAPVSRFFPREVVTRAQAAVALMSMLTEQERASLLTPEQTEDALASVADADSLSVYARPYIATALAVGILALDAGNRIHPEHAYSRTEMAAAFAAMQRRFPPSAATASLHLQDEDGR